MTRCVTFLLTDGEASEATVTALKLAERLVARDHRVAVFAAEDAVTLAAGEGEGADAVAALLRRGVHGATLDWVVDTPGARRAGVLGSLVPGVVPGDFADLWAFVRDSDVVLAPPRRSGGSG